MRFYIRDTHGDMTEVTQGEFDVAARHVRADSAHTPSRVDYSCVEITADSEGMLRTECAMLVLSLD